ncbi:hypothetical protein SGRIM128S_01975 [Streptomyces griseomycini]
MIMRWREEPSHRRRRRMRRVYAIYAGVIAALWGTFLLAEAPVARIYDLDTYYATTPWMREHILLYLVAHMVSSLVAASMLVSGSRRSGTAGSDRGSSSSSSASRRA